MSNQKIGLVVFESASLGCSSLTFRLYSADEALRTIADLGFTEFDLGIYPDACEHYHPLASSGDRYRFVDRVRALGLTARTLNVEPGHFSDSRTDQAVMWQVLLDEVRLAVDLGAIGLSLATGPPLEGVDRGELIEREARGFRRLAALAADEGLLCLAEAPHHGRVCDTVSRAVELLDQIDHPEAYLVLDTSHIAASGADAAETAHTLGPRARHVHLRDGRPGSVRLPIGDGEVDFEGFFRGLADVAYPGHFTFELWTAGSILSKQEEVVRAKRFITSTWSTTRGQHNTGSDYRPGSRDAAE